MSAARVRRDDRVAELSAEIDSLREQLARTQRLATVGTMASMLVHEFNNLLTPIVSYAEMAQQNPLLLEKAVEKAHHSGQQAKKICDAMLRMSRGHTGERIDSSVHAIILDALSTIPRSLDRDRIDLSVSVPEGLTIRTRPAELQQVLLNLILNARRSVLARPMPMAIGIQAVRVGNACAISVRDNGDGIDAENLGRVFDPFFSTADPAKGDGGTGLGLAVCKQIVESLGGTIAVDSTLGEGATFTLTMPVE
jgi:signal transduction histidine kinase